MPPRKRSAKAVLEPASEPPKHPNSGNAYDFDMEEDAPQPVAAAKMQPIVPVQRAASPPVATPVAVVSKLVEVNAKLAAPPKGKDALLKLLKVSLVPGAQSTRSVHNLHPFKQGM